MRFGRERRHKRWKLEETDNIEATAEERATEIPEAQEPSESPEASEGAEAPETPEANEEPEAKPAETPKPAEPDWKDCYARLMADFDNFKKRTARDREDTYRYAEADILKDILPTVDNLALALSKAEDRDSAFVKGVQLVYDGLLKSLKDHDAEPFDSVGEELDTGRMEAIAQLPNADVAEGRVSNEVKRGWMLKGKVLRAAQVVVSAGKPAEAN
jgi:molecular chaperone GrpE